MAKRIVISLPDWMFADLSARAAERQISVPELLREAVSQDRFIRDQIADTGSNLYIGEGRNRLQVLMPA